MDSIYVCMCVCVLLHLSGEIVETDWSAIFFAFSFLQFLLIHILSKYINVLDPRLTLYSNAIYMYVVTGM